MKLIQDRQAKINAIDALLSTGEKENRELNAAETAQHTTLTTEIRELDTKIATAKVDIELRDTQERLAKEAEAMGATPAPRSLTPDVHTGLSGREIRDLQGYSYVRALNQMLDGGNLSGLEKEMHREGEIEIRASGAQRAGGNLIIPQLILTKAGSVGSMEQRDLTATGGPNTQGGYTIETQLGSLIDRLRKKLIMQQMGVTMLGGLVGNVAFPKVIADDQALEKAENAVSAESSATFGQIALAPRRLPIFAEVSRQLLLQSSVDIEAWLRNDLAFQIAQVMDSRAIAGTGTAMPFGILNTVGVGSVAMGTNGGAPTYDSIVDLETAIANLDADVGALRYLTNTKVRGKMKKTLVAANTAGNMIWDRQNKESPLNDYPVGITNLVPSNLTKGSAAGICSAMAFGNFNDALMGQWGGLEMLVNPYSRDTEGIIRINCWTFYDFIVRRAESFAVILDYLTT